MQKHRLRKLGILVFLFVSVTGAIAATINGTASVKVLASLVLTKALDLNFGSAIKGDPAQTVATTAAEAASFGVTGEANQQVLISVSPASVNMTGPSGSTAIVVKNFVTSPVSGSNLDSTGKMTIKVGATRAAIPTTQMSGTYQGIFTVTVAYP